MLKRVFSFFISFVVLISCAGAFCVSAEDAEKATITAGDTSCTVNVGDEVYFTVRIEHRDGVDKSAGYVSYDPESLTYIEEKDELCMPYYEHSSVYYGTEEGRINFNSSGTFGSFAHNQVFITLKFKVKSATDSKLSVYFNKLNGYNNWVLIKDGALYDNRVIVTEFVSAEPEPRYLEIVHNGETYKAKVGDVVTYTLYLKAPKPIWHLHTGVDYDYLYLWPEETEFEQRYPNLHEGADEYVGNSQQFSGTVKGKGFTTSEYEILAQYNFNVLLEGKTSIDVNYGLYTHDDIRYTSMEENNVKLKSEITVKREDEPVEDPEISGDANGNGEVNIKDATTVQKASAKLITLDENSKRRSDVNADSKVNVKDATAIQKYTAKIATGYNIGEPLQ